MGPAHCFETYPLIAKTPPRNLRAYISSMEKNNPVGSQKNVRM